MEITKEEYLKALDVVNDYINQEKNKNIEIQRECKHNWVVDDGWGGALEGDTRCSICGIYNPNNWH